jgi:hypothetical protein
LLKTVEAAATSMRYIISKETRVSIIKNLSSSLLFTARNFPELKNKLSLLIKNSAALI